LEIAAVVDVPDDHFGHAAVVVGEVGQPDLLEELLLEGGGGDEGIKEVLSAFLVLGGRATCGGAGVGALVPPFLVELEHVFQLTIEVVAGLGGLRLVRGGVELEVSRGLGGVGEGGGLVGRLVGGSFLLRRLEGGGLFEHGVLLEFLLHEGLEFQDGRLEQREGLLELRGQHQLLRHALREMEALRHRVPAEGIEE
jgi:hypothetical protein